MLISDWSSDVCSADLIVIALRLRPVDDEAGQRPDIDDAPPPRRQHVPPESAGAPEAAVEVHIEHIQPMLVGDILGGGFAARDPCIVDQDVDPPIARQHRRRRGVDRGAVGYIERFGRSEEHTSELQSLMRISYAVFCLKKKNNNIKHSAKHLNKT